jgi:hypothetical protein
LCILSSLCNYAINEANSRVLVGYEGRLPTFFCEKSPKKAEKGGRFAYGARYIKLSRIKKKEGGGETLYSDFSQFAFSPSSILRNLNLVDKALVFVLSDVGGRGAVGRSVELAEQKKKQRVDWQNSRVPISRDPLENPLGEDF